MTDTFTLEDVTQSMQGPWKSLTFLTEKKQMGVEETLESLAATVKGVNEPIIEKVHQVDQAML